MGDSLKLKLKDPWFVKVVSKISQILLLITITGFILYGVSSRQGLSEEIAFFMLSFIGVVSFINIVLLFVNLVFLVLKDKKIGYKVRTGLYILTSFVLTIGIFIFVNSIYILSKGNLE